MKKLFARNVLLLLSLLAAPAARVDAQPPPDPAVQAELFRTISSLDSAFFDAYNRCDLEKIGSLLTEDLEFYHDQTGLSRSRQASVDAVKQNICGKVRREALQGLSRSISSRVMARSRSASIASVTPGSMRSVARTAALRGSSCSGRTRTVSGRSRG